MKRWCFYASAMLATIVAACDGTSGGASASPTPGSQPQIAIEFLEDKMVIVGTETIAQQNCGGTAESENQLQRTRSISHILEVSSGFSINANGQVGFAGTDVELGSTVATNLGYAYGLEESIARSLSVRAAAGKDMEHTIQLEEVWSTGTAAVTVGSQKAEIPFSFRKDFRISQLASRVVKDCKPELSFLEMVAGSYTLASWTEASGPIEIAMRVVEGTLEIDTTGTADWDVLLEQTFAVDPGQVRMTARGKLDLDTKRMLAVEGGAYNNTHYLDAKWGQVSSDVNLAVRGWNSGAPADAFVIALDTQSSGQQILQMTNSRGTFLWIKVN